MQELLCPVGNMESLHQAVMNGADAVYIGCKNFSARKFAQNFDNDEIIEAIKFCHLYGVKIYVTMNTLVKDNEVAEFLNQVEFLHKNGVDAVIVQDFGMICLIREKYPLLEVHASTQTNSSSKEIVQLFHKLGVKRVVLPREMSLEEIESIDVPIEKEVFVHGALCICYSGCCLMSSMLGNRSGNRGECVGSCRLLYTLKRNNELITKNKYLLSTKELNTNDEFKKILNSSIKSFKIEGRMKSPEYVGFITKYYRNIIDNNSEENETETNNLKTIYNREFTKGHLFNEPINNIMNTNHPNHIGLEIGKVIKVTPQKIKLKLTGTLNQQDAIRFLNSKKGFIVNYLYDKNDKLINSANDICYIDNKVDLKENDIVCKTKDYKLLESLKELPIRKVPITLKLTARINKPLQLEISDGTNIINLEGKLVEKSINSPTSKERLKEQLEKLGQTPFISKKTLIDSDQNIFIPIKELNELRRNITDKLIEKRSTNKKEFIIKNIKLTDEKHTINNVLTASVYTEEQLTTCLKLNVSRIYVQSEKLYEKYKLNEKIYYKVPRCSRNPLNDLKEQNLISDYIICNKERTIYNYTLNVTNIYTAYYLYKLGINTITLSVELTEQEILDFIKNYKNTFNVYPNIEVLTHGKVENMIIKGNVLNLNKDDYNYQLIDQKNRYFETYFDGLNTHILNCENKELKYYKRIKQYASIRLDFYNESKEVVEKVVNQYQ